MNLCIRRSSRTAIVALALLGGSACEDPAEFTEPEESTFSAVAIDRATVVPREGARLTAGPTEYEVVLDVAWQNMPAGSTLGVWLETHDSVTGQEFRWEGDLSATSQALTGASGTTRIDGTFTLPVVSPFCGSYDYLRILVVVFPGGEAPPNGAYRDEVFYPVSGSDWTGPCVANVFTVFPGTALSVGEPFLVYGRALPDALEVSLPGALQQNNVWPGFIRVPEGTSLLPVPDDGYMIAFVPVGAESGRVRAFDGGTEVRYGPNGVVDVTVAATQADVFEPNDAPAAATDSIFFNLWDPFAYWGAYGFNPSLTMTGADLTPDAVAPAYGLGDWFYLYQPFDDIGVELDLCINVTAHENVDDLDLYVYDVNGTIVAQGATASSSEGARVNGIANDDTFWVWVAPFLAGMNSDFGGYTYEVGICTSAAGTSIDRPDAPLGFKPAIGAGGGDAPRTPPAAPRVPEDRQRASRGGAR